MVWRLHPGNLTSSADPRMPLELTYQPEMICFLDPQQVKPLS